MYIKIAIVFFIAALFLTGCSEGTFTSPSSTAVVSQSPAPTASGPVPTTAARTFSDIRIDAPTSMSVPQSVQAVAMVHYSDNTTRLATTEDIKWGSTSHLMVSPTGLIQAVKPGEGAIWADCISAECAGRKFGPPAPSVITVAPLPPSTLAIVGVSPLEGDLEYTKPGQQPEIYADVSWGEIPVAPVSDPRSSSGRSFPLTQIMACGTADRKIPWLTCGMIILDCKDAWDFSTQTCKHKPGTARLRIPVSESAAAQGITFLDGVFASMTDRFGLSAGELYVTDDHLSRANLRARDLKGVAIRFHRSQ